MKKSDRYDTSSLPETQFEPGSRGRVLKSKLGIKSKRAMDRLEQSRILAAIRDSFLPKLLSGEISVKNAMRFVEMA